MPFKSDRQRRGFYGNKGRALPRGSGEGKQMNKSLQVHNIRRALKREGVDSDMIDVEAEVDKSLRYTENKENIITKIKRDPERYYAQHLDDESLSFEKDQARDFHDQRSEKSQQMDESIQAVRTINDREITKNANSVNRWYKAPNRLDIEGVDDV